MNVCIKNVTAVTADEICERQDIYIKEGKIDAILPAGQTPENNETVIFDAQGAYGLPGLIDLHIHGFAGYGPERGRPEELLEMSQALARHGVTAFCPTLYCAQPAQMENLLTRLTGAIGQEKGARIIGFHLEGPFISPQKPGAMKPQDIVPADVTVLEKLYRAANGKIAVLTLAPELENIGPVIDFCLAHHILVQAGHTNATYEEFIAGVRHGVTHATHAFNAMSPFTQRAPGAAGAVLMCPDVSCEIIADGVHVHPKIVSFLRHVKTGDNIVLVTDSLSPTAQAQGPFIANGDAVIFENGVWKRSSDRVIAGSALTMPQGIKNLVDFGYPLPQAARCASTNPARLVRLENRGQLCPGFWADITLLKTDFTPLATFIQGKQVA